MLYPMIAIILLTFIIGVITVRARFASVKEGTVKAQYYQLMNGEDVPEHITKTTRCFNNMFQVPVLFYVVGTLYISLGIENLIATSFAWIFVALRYIHTYVHLTYNHILHRVMTYWYGFLSVLVLWVNLIVLTAR